MKVSSTLLLGCMVAAVSTLGKLGLDVVPVHSRLMLKPFGRRARMMKDDASSELSDLAWQDDSVRFTDSTEQTSANGSNESKENAADPAIKEEYLKAARSGSDLFSILSKPTLDFSDDISEIARNVLLSRRNWKAMQLATAMEQDSRLYSSASEEEKDEGSKSKSRSDDSKSNSSSDSRSLNLVKKVQEFIRGLKDSAEDSKADRPSLGAGKSKNEAKSAELSGNDQPETI